MTCFGIHNWLTTPFIHSSSFTSHHRFRHVFNKKTIRLSSFTTIHRIIKIPLNNNGSFRDCLDSNILWGLDGSWK
uniref:Ovule protein n=1 Tax=Meloidogyne incognita TaxID=6306 RepID=A0A914LA11_MELIC